MGSGCFGWGPDGPPVTIAAAPSRFILGIASLIDKHRKELGIIECLEGGKPISMTAIGKWAVFVAFAAANP